MTEPQYSASECIRLDCLKLAVSSGDIYDDPLPRAREFYAFVTGADISWPKLSDNRVVTA